MLLAPRAAYQMRAVADGKSAGAPPWMLLRLGLETGPHHAAADEDRLSGMEVANVDGYRAFLARVFGFEVPVEQAVARVLGETAAVVRLHAKAERLRQDLLTLGLDREQIDRLPTCSPYIRTVPQAAGWLFVIVRHTLVAGLVKREIVRRLGTEVHTAMSYLDASSERPGAKFRVLGDALCSYATQGPPNAIVAAAHEAFRAQHQWYASTKHDDGKRRGADTHGVAARPR